MDRELGEFFVKFTTQGLSEVKSSIDDLSKKMDTLGDASDSATKKHEGFFGKIGGKGFGWIGQLAGLTSAVMALRTAWNQVANAAASTMTIYNQAMLSGTDPQTLERWQNLATRKGLNAGEIFSDFRAGQDLLKQFEYAEITEDFNKVFGRVGLDSSAIIKSVNEGNLNAVFEMLNKALSKQTASGAFVIDSADAERVMRQLGFGDTMLSLLRIAELPTLLKNTNLVYTENPDTLRASAEYTEAKAVLREDWNRIWADPRIIDAATALLKYLDQTVLPSLYTFFNWILDKIGSIFETAGTTEGEKNLGKLLKGIAGGAAFAGAAALGAPVLPALAVAGGAMFLANKGHKKLLEEDWYKKFANASGSTNTAPANFWDNYDAQYTQMLAAADAGQVQPWYAGMNMPEQNNEASAVINLNGIKVVERHGRGTTTIDMNLDEVPMATIGG